MLKISCNIEETYWGGGFAREGIGDISTCRNEDSGVLFVRCSIQKLCRLLEVGFHKTLFEAPRFHDKNKIQLSSSPWKAASPVEVYGYTAVVLIEQLVVLLGFIIKYLGGY